MANKSLATTQKNTHGVWILDFLGNLSGMAYQYRVNFEHHTQVTSDPYSIATTADGMRTAILSRADRQFDWGPKKEPMRLLGAWTILVKQ